MSNSSPGNAGEMSGNTTHARTSGDTWAIKDPGGNVAGNTYSGTDTDRLMQSYESIFGPAGRDIKIDPQRHKRHQRWHLPDNLKGRNEYLTDRIDGLITDATSSPFTRNILPYLYLESPDQKIKWNVYSFDEGMASRVPYESAARVLTQSKTTHAGYAVRQGLAIVMEHNFLASAAGIANFQNQLKQLVGSIQLTNDLDVHVALLQAVSFQRTMEEKYYSEDTNLYDASKKYVDMFGIMQKIPNALDILIEDAKSHLKTWGSQPPTFLLCPSDLTAQLQMTPERTNYITNGPDGLRRLAEGPNLPSYRGLSIIHSQKFSLEPGRKPRNVLKRRVRVAEYYWIDLSSVSSYQIYNQKKDMMVTFDRIHAAKASHLRAAIAKNRYWSNTALLRYNNNPEEIYKSAERGFCLLVRPNIEHEMLTVIAGRGGTQELGATFWGQTELACYDDAQHGIWGMSYKYHERAIVTNERNLIRMFDVAFDGYSGGMDTDIAKLHEINTDMAKHTYGAGPRYDGNSIIALHFPRYLYVPTLTNRLIKLLMQIFVPQLHDKGNDYDYAEIPSADVGQCSAMLHEMYKYLGGTDVFTEQLEYATLNFELTELVAANAAAEARHDELERVRLANLEAARPAFTPNPRIAQLQLRLQGKEAFVAEWAKHVVACIKHLTEKYQKARPHEPRADLYARILQLVFKEFRGNSVEVMGPARANTFLTFLLSKIGDINDRSFQEAFDICLEIMLMDFKTPAESVTAATRMQIHMPPSRPGADLPPARDGAASTQEIQYLTKFLCLLHGIEVQYHGVANIQYWQYYRNGNLVAYNEIHDLLKQHGHDDVDDLLKHNQDMSKTLVVSFARNHQHCMDLAYNLHLLQKPAFEVPNPLILCTIMQNVSNNKIIVGTNPEGTTNCDKDNLHNFQVQYKKYISEDENNYHNQTHDMNQIFDDFLLMYNELCNNMCTLNDTVPASICIQNNQTELPAMAYHGNLTMEKSKGGRDEVRCVGHLGNSFPGCACIREGKGMVNMFQSMPTPVHVM